MVGLPVVMRAKTEYRCIMVWPTGLVGLEPNGKDIILHLSVTNKLASASEMDMPDKDWHNSEA